MKKILSLIPTFFIAAFIYCQDTIYTRNNSLQARHWYYLQDWFEHAAKDSVDRIFFKRLRETTANKTLLTVVVVDSVPGKWAKRAVEIVLNSPHGEVKAGVMDAIIDEFKSKPQMTATITAMEVVHDTEYIRKRKNGKAWAEQ